MKLSQEKKDKIFEQILLFLYNTSPKQPFTSEIAKELARDEEFIKKLLFELKSKKFVTHIRRNSKGFVFTRRIKWRLTNHIYKVYQQHQS